MKTFVPFLTLALIIALCAFSSILYLNMNYVSSAMLTVLWVVGITLWISVRVKEKQSNQ